MKEKQSKYSIVATSHYRQVMLVSQQFTCYTVRILMYNK